MTFGMRSRPYTHLPYKMLLRVLFLCLLPGSMLASDPLSWTELQRLYHADLAIDARFVRQDDTHLWVKVLAVLRDRGHGIASGDHIRVDKAVSYDCGYSWNIGDLRRWRLYLQKEEGKGHWALLRNSASSAIHVIHGQAIIHMPAQVELPILEFDRCMIELQTCYDLVDSTDSFIARCPQPRIDSLAAHNAILAQFEKQGRTVTAAHLFEPPEVPVMEPLPAPMRECVWLDERPRKLGTPAEANAPPIQLSVVDPTPDALEPRTVVRVVVDLDGQLRDATILRASTPQRDTAALRAISALPVLEPGRTKGVPTACFEVFPVRFTIPKE